MDKKGNTRGGGGGGALQRYPDPPPPSRMHAQLGGVDCVRRKGEDTPCDQPEVPASFPHGYEFRRAGQSGQFANGGTDS